MLRWTIALKNIYTKNSQITCSQLQIKWHLSRSILQNQQCSDKNEHKRKQHKFSMFYCQSTDFNGDYSDWHSLVHSIRLMTLREIARKRSDQWTKFIDFITVAAVEKKHIKWNRRNTEYQFNDAFCWICFGARAFIEEKSDSIIFYNYSVCPDGVNLHSKSQISINFVCVY